MWIVVLWILVELNAPFWVFAVYGTSLLFRLIAAFPQD